ncbi:MAG: dihydrodipicolinate synthase family protein [Beijerinckiaceae bacterium]|jgi:4-hydroxy-tetrahydrodipicolinate synthase|nr:dihydrodipicolinate synthase family protein [Beijerinckiaceae bacterium]
MTPTSTNSRIGLNCALSTPFQADGQVCMARLVSHAQWVLANGCDGFTLFGTTGEGASLAHPERNRMLGAIGASGIDLRRKVMVGVSAATLDDAVEQARTGYAMDCRALLLAPPFYFGNASDEGLFRFFAALFDQLGGQLRDVILYHIPGMTRNGISVELTQRLAKAYPGVVVGVKDSNGDWNATERRLTELPGLQILVGDERQLARSVRSGGAGSICGLANIAPDLLRPLANEGKDDPRINAMVDAILKHSFMSAIKAMIAERTGDAGWRVMRAPLDPMTEAAARELAATLAALRSGASAAA